MLYIAVITTDGTFTTCTNNMYQACCSVHVYLYMCKHTYVRTEDLVLLNIVTSRYEMQQSRSVTYMYMVERSV